MDVIYTFARDQGAPFKGEISFETACEENSGFQEVSQSGSPYFCNDIPAQKGAYKNPRLYADRLRSYSESNLRALRKYFSKNAMPDEEWINCWKDVDDKKRPPATSCYKSTLIMPMTLLAKQVTEEFVSAYNKHWPPVQNKYNFGYLCIDCHEIDFFEDYDKVVLFAHTDMFSLFLIEAYSFVLHSNTYAEVEAAIKKYEKSMRKTQQKPLHPRKRNAS